MKVTRLDEIVDLDETQRGQMFGLMARGSRDFDPAMRFEGLGDDTGPIPKCKPGQDAILSILTPAQRDAYQADRDQKRDAARKEMESMGLSLPDGWDASDSLDF